MSNDDFTHGNDDYEAWRRKMDDAKSRRDSRDDDMDVMDDVADDPKIVSIMDKILDLLKDKTNAPQPCSNNQETQFERNDELIIRRLADKLDAVSESVDRLTNATQNTFDDIYDRLSDSVQTQPQVTRGPVKMNSTSTMGNFVQTSNENNVTDDIIDNNINGALQN